MSDNSVSSGYFAGELDVDSTKVLGLAIRGGTALWGVTKIGAALPAGLLTAAVGTAMFGRDRTEVADIVGTSLTEVPARMVLSGLEDVHHAFTSPSP